MLSIDKNKKIDLMFLIQFKQFTIVSDFLEELYDGRDAQSQIVKQAKEELGKGAIEKCSELLEVLLFFNWSRL